MQNFQFKKDNAKSNWKPMNFTVPGSPSSFFDCVKELHFFTLHNFIREKDVALTYDSNVSYSSKRRTSKDWKELEKGEPNKRKEDKQRNINNMLEGLMIIIGIVVKAKCLV